MTQVSEALTVIMTVGVLTLAIGEFGRDRKSTGESADEKQVQQIGAREFHLDDKKRAVEIKIRPLYTSSPETGAIQKYLVDAKKMGILEHWSLEQAAADGEEVYCAEISSKQVTPGVFADLQKIHTDILITDYEVTSVRSCNSPVAGL